MPTADQWMRDYDPERAKRDADRLRDLFGSLPVKATPMLPWDLAADEAAREQQQAEEDALHAQALASQPDGTC